MQIFYAALDNGLSNLVEMDNERLADDVTETYTENALKSWFELDIVSFGAKIVKSGTGTRRWAVAVVTVGIAALYVLAYTGADATTAETIHYVINSLSVAVDTLQLVSHMVKMVNSLRGVTSFKGALSALNSVNKLAIKGAVVGAIFAVAVTWGTVFYLMANADSEYERKALIAYGAAATVVVILMIALLYIPIVGQLLALFVALFDTLAYIICTAIDSEDFVCQGITGMLTTVLADVFYSVDVGADLSDMDYQISGPTYQDTSAGYTTDNAVSYSAVLTHTIFDGVVDRGPFGISWTTEGDIAHKTKVAYVLQGSDTDLDLDTVDTDWDEDRTTIWYPCGYIPIYFPPWYIVLLCREGEISKTFNPDDMVIYFSDLGTGINRQSDVYLTGAYKVPIRECSFGVCWVDDWEEMHSHSNIGEYIYFDIFPTTLDGFYDLTAKDGGYALSWGQSGTLTFPRLKDADNDGLRNIRDGGSDPDDNDLDSDDDGLSDYAERSNGTNPQDADSDNDGLSDYEELRYGTDPWSDDGDDDGLSDVFELEGWSVGYFAADGTIQDTWVWSDPAIDDADGDSLSDYDEALYGLNPNVQEDPDILNSALTFENMEVAETAAPLLLLQFEETGGYAFSDVSGEGYIATCSGSACPTAGYEGRYGYALSFDGGDTLTTTFGSVAFAKGDFSIGVWVKTNAITQTILTKSDGDTSWEAGEKILHLISGIPYFAGYSNFSIGGSTAVNDGDWHHVAVVWDYDGSGTGGTGKMYVDGVDDTDTS
ncbi:MAG: LamG-like jellyroll fold domain-containing protein, partial [Anaerolineae bacterium]